MYHFSPAGIPALDFFSVMRAAQWTIGLETKEVT